MGDAEIAVYRVEKRPTFSAGRWLPALHRSCHESKAFRLLVHDSCWCGLMLLSYHADYGRNPPELNGGCKVVTK